MTGTHQSTFFAPCPRGLETVLRDELIQLSAEDIVPLQGGVQFRGPFDLCYHVNLHSRIASRVLWAISECSYLNEHDVYHKAVSLNWPSWFAVNHRIKVHVSAHHCPLPSLEFVTLRIKDAICDHFRKAQGSRPNVDTRNPDIGIYAFLDDQNCTFYLDTTGEPLFKRGYRRAQGPSPLRENLAAGILSLAGWTPGQVLLDPMCGSGTFLLEAAQIACNIAPGCNRAFAFENFLGFDQDAWTQLLAKSQAEERTMDAGTLFGFDHDPQAVSAAKMNVEAAGFANIIAIDQADVLEIQPTHSQGLLITNPPYGVRSGQDTQLDGWYPQLGDALKRHFMGWRAFLFTADLRLPKRIRLAATRRTPLFNGALECRLFEYPIVQGSNRSKPTPLPLST
ncbi:MAG: THUMP domain-containing protein [Nitrospirae bacterium]|nr:THUMP domain-containing protein [Nitrospirota bacterium]MDA1303366.1 THUMP domain-containing protein [Nitrospirota bacterium]